MEASLGKLISLQSNARRGGWSAWLLTGLTLLGLSGCGPGHEIDCLKSNGPVTTQRRAVSRQVRTVAVYDNVDLVIVPDTATYAEVRAGENVVNDIELSTPGGPGFLTIRNTSRCNWVRSYDTPREVRLHVPHLRDVAQRGYGRLSNEGRWAQDTLFVRLVGTGSIDLNLTSTYLFVDNYDAGDLTLRGSAYDFHPNLGSNGFLFADGLDTFYCYFTTFPTWVGDAHVLVRQNLGGVLKGSGTFYYRGPPSYIDVTGPNAGRLVRR